VTILKNPEKGQETPGKKVRDVLDKAEKRIVLEYAGGRGLRDHLTPATTHHPNRWKGGKKNPNSLRTAQASVWRKSLVFRENPGKIRGQRGGTSVWEKGKADEKSIKERNYVVKK